MLKRWKKLGTELVLENPWWRYRRDTFELPSGKQGEYHYCSTNGSSMIVPCTDDGRFIMVEQYRYLCDRDSIEFPCGGVQDGRTHEETAIEELAQEAGVRAAELVEIGRFNPFNGVTDEICRVYKATGLTTEELPKDETEEFKLHYLLKSEVNELIRSNKIWDGMTLATWHLLNQSLSD